MAEDRPGQQEETKNTQAWVSMPSPPASRAAPEHQWTDAAGLCPSRAARALQRQLGVYSKVCLRVTLLGEGANHNRKPPRCATIHVTAQQEEGRVEQAEIKALEPVVSSHLGEQPVQRLREAKGHLGAGSIGPLWPCWPSCHPSNTAVCSPLPAFACTVSRPHVTGSSQVPPPPEGRPDHLI